MAVTLTYWEYEVQTPPAGISIKTYLNNMGKQAWNLVAVIPPTTSITTVGDVVCYFKREIDKPK